MQKSEISTSHMIRLEL